MLKISDVLRIMRLLSGGLIRTYLLTLAPVAQRIGPKILGLAQLLPHQPNLIRLVSLCITILTCRGDPDTVKLCDTQA